MRYGTIQGKRPIISVSATRNLALADVDSYLNCTNSAAITLTISADTFSGEVEIDVARNGSGAVTITAGTGVTLNGVATGSKTIAIQYQAVTLKRIAANTWVIHGNYS